MRDLLLNADCVYVHKRVYVHWYSTRRRESCTSSYSSSFSTFLRTLTDDLYNRDYYSQFGPCILSPRLIFALASYTIVTRAHARAWAPMFKLLNEICYATFSHLPATFLPSAFRLSKPMSVWALKRDCSARGGGIWQLWVRCCRWGATVAPLGGGIGQLWVWSCPYGVCRFWHFFRWFTEEL